MLIVNLFCIQHIVGYFFVPFKLLFLFYFFSFVKRSKKKTSKLIPQLTEHFQNVNSKCYHLPFKMLTFTLHQYGHASALVVILCITSVDGMLRVLRGISILMD